MQPDSCLQYDSIFAFICQPQIAEEEGDGGKKGARIEDKGSRFRVESRESKAHGQEAGVMCQESGVRSQKIEVRE